VATHESRALNQIMDTFHIIQRRRQKEMSVMKKTWWAIHDKKNFDASILVVSFNIDDLEKISESLNVLERQKKKLAFVIGEIDDKDSLKLLVEAKEADENTESASSGHSFMNTIIGERARVTMGNAGISTSVGHKFRDTTITGANVHMGDMSDAAAASFWNISGILESGKN
jgi:Prion-inhibition and propagation